MQAREETEALVRLAALQAVALRVDVERWVPVTRERALRAPLSEGAARATIAIALPREIEPNHVEGARLVETILLFTPDDVVGRRHDRRDRADDSRIVEDAAKRPDGGHALTKLSHSRRTRIPATASMTASGIAPSRTSLGTSVEQSTTVEPAPPRARPPST